MRVSPLESASSLRSRSLEATDVLEFVRTNLPAPPAEWPPVSWNLEELTLAGFYYQPGLAVARSQWETATATGVTAAARPNPVLSVIPGYNVTPLSLTPGTLASPWFPAINVDVPIETFGKRGYRRARAAANAESARFALIQTAWQVRSAIRTALLEVSYQEARLQALQELADLEIQVVAVAQQRLDAGAAAVLEVGQRRIAADRARLDVAEGRRVSAVARARLAEALGIPAAGIAAATLDFPLDPDAGVCGPLPEPSLRDAALLSRADVLAALSDFASSQSSLQLEIARQFPDIHLVPGYQFDQGNHKWSLGLSLELPVLNQNQGPIAEARARRTEAAARFVAVQARVMGQLDQAFTNRTLALAALASATDLEVSGTGAVRAAEAGLNAGASDALEVLTVRLERIAVVLARLDAAYRTQQALGQLEDAVQQPFRALCSVESSPRGPGLP